MTKLGYNRGFSAAITAAGSLITPIIPPGIALIIYAFVADVSVGKMFMAAIIPTDVLRRADDDGVPYC